MDFAGIDLHKTSSQICTLSEGGELTERRIKTTRATFDEVFAARPRARILVEASTESEWVACYLESLGHEVIYVLHAFQKKSKRGVETPKSEIELIKNRLKLAKEHYGEWRRDNEEHDEEEG